MESKDDGDISKIPLRDEVNSSKNYAGSMNILANSKQDEKSSQELSVRDEEKSSNEKNYAGSMNILANSKQDEKSSQELSVRDEEISSNEKKIPYPRSVFIIIGNEFCERFSYYGMKNVLPLYLTYQLHFTETSSTLFYHLWSCLCYFTPLPGAIIADALLGKYKTILYISILYMIGNVILSFSAMSPVFGDNLTAKICISLIGLITIALGTGGIKPCVSAFGGDQFVLPQQEKQLASFFSVFYFSINSGSLLSNLITPILRADVSCFGDDCYALAFGVPAVLMFVATGLFFIGNYTTPYKKVPPTGSIMAKVLGICWAGIKGKCNREVNKEHWLDHADGKFDHQLIQDTKKVTSILLIFLPLPFYWALFDQQGSRWTFQATRMNGNVAGWFTIKPDQISVVNPLMILILIPLFEKLIYPCLGHYGILNTSLKRMGWGGVLAGLAFIISGFLELALEKTYAVEVQSHESRLVFINSLPCDINIDSSVGNNVYNTSIPKLLNQELYTDHTKLVHHTFDLNGTSAEMKIDVLFSEKCPTIVKQNIQAIKLQEKKAHTILITANDASELVVKLIDPEDDYKKGGSILANVRMIYNLPVKSSISLEGEYDNHTISTTKDIGGGEFNFITPGKYNAYLLGNDKTSLGSIDVNPGGIYNLLVQRPLNYDTIKIHNFEITPWNSIHMLWLVPQYLVLTTSEVLFSISGLEFSFSQAPLSMKSIMQSSWLLTVSMGNVIVMIISGAHAFEEQSKEFFLFAGLMYVDLIAFGALAYNYEYVEDEEDNQKHSKSHRNELLASFGILEH